MVCCMYGMLCVQQIIVYINGYYIGPENIRNYFNINMVLKSVKCSVVTNGYYEMVLY